MAGLSTRIMFCMFMLIQVGEEADDFWKQKKKICWFIHEQDLDLRFLDLVL